MVLARLVNAHTLTSHY